MEPAPEGAHHPRRRPEEQDEAEETRRARGRGNRLDRSLDVFLAVGVDREPVDDPVGDALAPLVVLEDEPEDRDQHDRQRREREEHPVGDARRVLRAAGGEVARAGGTGNRCQAPDQSDQPGRRQEEVQQERVDELRGADVGPMPASRNDLEPCIRHRRDDSLGKLDGNRGIGFAVDDERRTVDPRQETRRPYPVELALLGDDHLRRRLEADRDHLGDHVGRAWFREDVVHERHDEPGPVDLQGLEPPGPGGAGSASSCMYGAITARRSNRSGSSVVSSTAALIPGMP